MKNLVTSLLLLVLVAQLPANTLYDQLCAFNPNWTKYADRAPNGKAKVFATDAEYVATHLKYVIKILRSNPTDHLNTEQLATRTELIDVLDEYRRAGRFPQNYYSEVRMPVFIDEHNTHCAVGHLLRHTGHETVAQRIASTNNLAWVKEITDPAVPSWQQASGFTVEELKLIQGVYDWYQPNALVAHNRFDIPQKPEVMVKYFNKKQPKKKENVWLFGEGKNG